MALRRRTLLAHATVAALVAAGLTVLASTAAVAAVPAGFVDTAVISGLTSPTAVVFGADGRVFIAQKNGVIKTYDSLADTTATTVADLRPAVHNFWDRGLLGLALDPAYPTRPYLYALYSYDAEPGGTHPRWGDQCPSPPGATQNGCLITGRLSRLTLDAGHVAIAETVLIRDWCQQFPSHSVGTATFGADGALYVTGGEGASFNYADYGQTGNPCGDPPSPAGVNLTPPTAEGGALRAQSVRRPAGEPVTLDGTVVRVDPDTGAWQIVAYGLRNPFRMTARPGTGELWIGDVGAGTWEEVNRLQGATQNFGWPCYEGAARHGGFDSANLNLCESLYAAGPAAHHAPYYAYHHLNKVVPTDPCPTGSSSIAGLAFEHGSSYPAAYRGALFFADYSRNCIWAMQAGPSGDPDPSRLVPFVTGASGPVQVVTGPGGDIFYIAMNSGELHRVSYPTGNRAPTAVATATPPSGPAPLAVQFDGTSSGDPDGDAITYAWDLDGDGAYDDSTDPRPAATYATSTLVGLRVSDTAGAAGTTTIAVTIDREDPLPVIDSPASALRWTVGQTVAFTGHAVDQQDGALPASALSWRLVMQHCPSNCHAHELQTFDGVASGSFAAPDHEYPSYLELTLTATDSTGRSASTTVRLDPRTVALSFATSPVALQLVVNGVPQTAPFTRTVIVGSANSISAPTPQTTDRRSNSHVVVRYSFNSWSDGGAATHNITAPAAGTTYTAGYTKCMPGRPCWS